MHNVACHAGWLEKAFVSVMQRVLRDKDVITDTCREMLDELDIAKIDAEVAWLKNEESSVAERLRKLVEENARMRRDQEEYRLEYDALANEYDRINAQIQAMEDQNRDKKKHRRKLAIFLSFLKKAQTGDAFEPYTFVTLVEKGVVGRDGRLQFCFRNGMVYEYPLTKSSIRSIKQATSRKRLFVAFFLHLKAC